MLLEPDEPGRSPCVVAIFGVGLIGSSLLSSLRADRRFAETELPIQWLGREARRAQFDRIEEGIQAALATAPGAALRVVWAAGQGGFGSTDEDTQLELEAFEAVTERVRRISERSPDTVITLAVLSSAGGLFEGQRIVGAESEPSPRRPYGYLKLRQEELARVEGEPWIPKIMRLTSVYGFIRPGQRLGLVSTLVRNGLRQERTRITGRMDTLRDFIWVGDVTRHLSAVLLDDDAASVSSVDTLASCKPSSLAEVQQLVHQTLGRRVYVSYATVPTNEVDITFRRDVLPRGFETTDLRSNVIRIHMDALQSGLALVREPIALRQRVA